jgi:hypothetical protein
MGILKVGIILCKKIIKKIGAITIKIKLKTENKKPYLIIQYENCEWDTIENILTNVLGLEKREVINGWGKGIKLMCYVETNQELKDYVYRTFRSDKWFDNINEPFVHLDYVNLAFLRVIPDEKRRVYIPLDKFLTIAELNQIVYSIVDIYKILLNLANDVEINISVKNGD